MSNLKLIGKIGALLFGVTLVVAACGSDDSNSAEQSSSYSTSYLTTTPATPPPSCVEQGMVPDPEHSDTPWKKSCATQAELDARNTSRREHNDALAAANQDLVNAVESSGDQLVTLMNVFCPSSFRSEEPQHLVGQPYPASPISYRAQAERLWNTYWFSNNLWLAPYDFSQATARICGSPSPSVSTPPSSQSGASNDANTPGWAYLGYEDEEECEQHMSMRMCR